MVWTVLNVTLYYMIPGPICWRGKSIPLLTDMRSRNPALCPLSASCSLPRRGTSWCWPGSLMSPAAAPLPCLPAAGRQIPGPRSQLRGLGRARDSPGLIRLQGATDKEHLGIRRRAELSTNHTRLENEGKQFAKFCFPSCSHLKKAA